VCVCVCVCVVRLFISNLSMDRTLTETNEANENDE